MKKVLFVATIADFIASFEISDIRILQEMEYEVHIAANFDNVLEDSLKKLQTAKVKFHNVPIQRTPYSMENIKAINKQI